MEENSTEVVEQSDVKNIDNAGNKAANVGAKAAEWTHKGSNAWKALAFIIVAGLAGGLLLSGMNQQDDVQAEGGWDKYFALINEIQAVQSRKTGGNSSLTQGELENVKEVVDDIIANNVGLRSAMAAQVLMGDLYLETGMRILYSDREAADEHLTNAQTYYEMITETPPIPSQRMKSWIFIRGALGMSQAAEARLYSDPSEGLDYEISDDSDSTKDVDAFEYHTTIAIGALNSIKALISSDEQSVLYKRLDDQIALIESLTRARWEEGEGINSGNFYSWLAQYQPPVIEAENGSGIQLENNINTEGEIDPDRESEFNIKDDPDNAEADESVEDSQDNPAPNESGESTSEDGDDAQ